MKSREKVLTHRTLLAAIWCENGIEQTEYPRVFLGNLRKNIEDNPSAPKCIVTESWVGYSFKP